MLANQRLNINLSENTRREVFELAEIAHAVHFSAGWIAMSV